METINRPTLADLPADAPRSAADALISQRAGMPQDVLTERGWKIVTADDKAGYRLPIDRIRAERLATEANAIAERWRATLGTDVEDVAQDAMLAILEGRAAPDDIATVVKRLARATEQRHHARDVEGARERTGTRVVSINDASVLATIADARDPRLTPVPDNDAPEWMRVSGGPSATGLDSKGREASEGLSTARMIVPGVADSQPGEVIAEAADAHNAREGIGAMDAGSMSLALISLHDRLQADLERAQSAWADGRKATLMPLPKRLISEIRTSVVDVMRQHAHESGRAKPDSARWQLPTVAGRTWAQVSEDEVSHPAKDGRAYCIACLPVGPVTGPADACDHEPLPMKRPRVVRPHTPDAEADGMALLSLGSGPVRKASGRRKGGSGATGPTVMVGTKRRWTDAGRGDHS